VDRNSCRRLKYMWFAPSKRQITFLLAAMRQRLKKVRRNVILPPHLCPSKPPRLCPRTGFLLHFFFRRSIMRCQVCALRSFLSVTARGWRLLSLVLPTCIFFICETLAEIRYRPMSAPSAPQVAGDVQKRANTNNYRSWLPLY
jgi:hypothetical protein